MPFIFVTDGSSLWRKFIENIFNLLFGIYAFLKNDRTNSKLFYTHAGSTPHELSSSNNNHRRDIVDINPF